ncbi:Leucine-rich repeat-containing G-protein coupled receptor 5 [Nymphon striatum]|nr:Leucine-rich repeat-containing G-protein coupled receptor 5 [Nymphon striatum]
MLITCVKSNDTTNTVEDLKFTGILQTDLNCYIAPPGFLVPKDLAGNQIGKGKELTFGIYRNLKRIVLDGNDLTSIPAHLFVNIQHLEDLSLKNNKLVSVPVNALTPVKNLQKLFLSSNLITDNEDRSLKNANLKQIWLDHNRLKNIPIKILNNVHQLDVLHLGGNLITKISFLPLHSLSNLVYLLLEDNKIKYIDKKAFSGLYSLRVLSLSGNKINFISRKAFKRNKALQVIKLDNNPLFSVDIDAFSDLPNLLQIILPNLRNQKKFLNLTNCRSVERLEIDRAKIEVLPKNFCSYIPKLTNLDFNYGHLTEIPENKFQRQDSLVHLHLAFNRITTIYKNSFSGLDNIQLLDLEGNSISVINPQAFLATPKLNDLNLGVNQFSKLPTAGLQNLRIIKVHNNVNLKSFPSPVSFPKIHELVLSYAYHCCNFLSEYNRNDSGTLITSSSGDKIKESVIWMKGSEIDMDMWGTGKRNKSLTFHTSNGTENLDELANEYWQTFGAPELNWSNLAGIQDNEEMIKRRVEAEGEEIVNWRLNHDIKCTPRPGPFLPCDDLFGWWTLRCGIWIVFLLALLGNGAVVIVSIFSRTKMDVPRFLVCNLAIADFFMGIYLGFLAMLDASTLGHFKWQFSAGCQMAGFLGVLSSELSVFTLSVITLERHYAITHAMHLNKRLSIRHAAYIMTVAWIFSLTLAILPLVGISDYRKFAVCLPFEIESSLSLGYVVFLMLINGVAFTVLMGCYLKMYCSIRGSQAWNSNDCRIAKRMALLVFTDFFCWAPIAFFAFFAVGGLNIISVEGAKVLTIFVLPFNSCANPFLYAITTKQFKKDCVVICKRIEESRVTRGIGRRRNSSNFSNRHNEQYNSAEVKDDKMLVKQSNGIHQVKGNTKPEYARQLIHSPIEFRSGNSDSAEKRSWGLDKLRNFFCESKEYSSRGKLHSSRSGVDNVRAKSDVGHSFFSRKGQKPLDMASSVSSENFSSRSDSWRNNSIPMRLLDRNVMATAMIAISRSSFTSADTQSLCGKSSITPVSSIKGDKRTVHATDSEGMIPNTKSSFSNLRERAQNSNSAGSSYKQESMQNFRKPRLCRQVALDEPRSVSSPPMSPLATNTYPDNKDTSKDTFCKCANNDVDTNNSLRTGSNPQPSYRTMQCGAGSLEPGEELASGKIKGNRFAPSERYTSPMYLGNKLPILSECRSRSDDSPSAD